MSFNETYYEKYGKVAGRDTPCFLLGTSMGGLQSSYISTTNHMKYEGVCLAVPYFGLKDPTMIEKIRPMVQAMAKVSPNQSIPIMDYKKAPLHVRDYL